MRRRAAVAVGLCALALERGAWAWLLGGDLRIAAVCPTRRSGPAPLRAEQEVADFDCTATEGETLRCTVRARYLLRNPSGAPVEVDFPAQPPVEGAVTRLMVDGGRPLSAPAGNPGRVALTVGAGEARAVTLEARFEASIENHRRPFGPTSGALDVMHPLLVRPESDGVRVEFSYDLTSGCGGGRAVERSGAATVITRLPRGWRPTQGYEQRGLCHEDNAGLVCAQMEELSASVEMIAERDALSVSPRSGGPFVGLGGTFDRCFRTRVGYEFGLSRRILGAVAVDIGSSSDLIGAALLGVAIRPWHPRDDLARWLAPWGFIPWVGVVGGVLSDRRGGARAQLTIPWIIAALELSVDYWPTDRRVDTSLLVRFGF